MLKFSAKKPACNLFELISKPDHLYSTDQKKMNINSLIGKLDLDMS